MPKRLIDGEALWTSGKLKRVSPVELRLHYANWLPLAEANGVFEVDFDIIRARIYPIICPSFSTESVQQVFDEFVRVGLLQTWSDGDKQYAYFTGIEKPGRLPSEKHLKRYKGLPPDHPGLSGTAPGVSRNTPRGFGVGLVLDRNGTGKEKETLPALTGFDDLVDRWSED